MGHAIPKVSIQYLETIQQWEDQSAVDKDGFYTGEDEDEQKNFLRLDTKEMRLPLRKFIQQSCRD